MARIGPQPPPNTVREMPYSAARMTSTLAAFYDRKRKVLGPEFGGYYDDALGKLFAHASSRPQALKASRFLRTHRRRIVNSVTTWTPQRKFDIDTLLGRLIRRCDTLGLYVQASEAESLIEATALISAIANRALRTHCAGEES